MHEAKKLFPQRKNNLLKTIKKNNLIILLFKKEEVLATATKIKTGNASDADEIVPEVIKRDDNKILEYIVKVFNQILKKGIFPENWKQAKVVLLTKRI